MFFLAKSIQDKIDNILTVRPKLKLIHFIVLLISLSSHSNLCHTISAVILNMLFYWCIASQGWMNNWLNLKSAITDTECMILFKLWVIIYIVLTSIKTTLLLSLVSVSEICCVFYCSAGWSVDKVSSSAERLCQSCD